VLKALVHKNFVIVAAFLLLQFQSLWTKATHIVGGELTYVCLGNNDYRITLKVYRDCYNGQPPYDNPAILGIYDNNQNLVTTVNMAFPGSALVPPAIISPCLIPPTNVCVEEAVYEEVVNLPNIPGGYHLVYQRCCRNNTISNIDAPGNTGATYTAYIPDQSVVTCNSSPVFTNFPPVFLCADVPINFDHAAIDPDGDSLVYSLCNPFDGGSTMNPSPNPPDPPPFPFVTFTPPFSATVPLGGTLPLTINQNTGWLTGTPQLLGQFVVAVCVSEYRNGVLISTNKRDFQFNIVFCDAAIASIPAQQVFCDGFTVDFVGSSINGTNYFWNFGDPGTNTDTSSLALVSYTYPDSGNYTVMLVAYDPLGNCYDTAYQTFQVYPLLEPGFTPPPAQCLLGNSFDVQAGGAFTPDATFQWDFGSGASPQSSTLQNPNNISFNSVGPKVVSLTISQYGCTETYIDTLKIVPEPVADISDINRYCIGNAVSFGNNSVNSTAYYWDFGVLNINTDTSTLFQPNYLFQDSGIYLITLISYSEGVCADTTTELFYVYPLLNPDINGAGDQCLSNNSFNFQAAGAYTIDATFQWDFGATATPLASTQQNVNNVVFSQLGDYPVTITMSQYGCTKSYTDTVGLFRNPEAGFLLEDFAGCVPFKFKLTDTSNFDTPPLYSWNMGDNSSLNVPSPEYTYYFPGIYDITLTIITTSGCIDTSVFTLQNAVQVEPLPVPGLIVETREVSIFEPYVSVADSSSLRTGCRVYMGDGTYYDTCNVTHTYADTGVYRITQVVVNELGCKDSIMVDVYVFGEFRLFVPNCFTPNADGMNDQFLPSMMGVEQFYMEIYNRWGERIFQTSDQSLGWDGTYDGAKSPQDGYVYRLTVKAVRQSPKTYTGSVTLLR
jgi:gliding motility-associated-like protein